MESVNSECCIKVKVPAPIVRRPRLLKHAGVDQGVREGRGFSELELKEAGITVDLAKELGIPVDKRRRSCHPWNVEALKKFLEEIKPLIEAKKGKPARLVQQKVES